MQQSSAALVLPTSQECMSVGSTKATCSELNCHHLPSTQDGAQRPRASRLRTGMISSPVCRPQMAGEAEVKLKLDEAGTGSGETSARDAPCCHLSRQATQGRQSCRNFDLSGLSSHCTEPTSGLDPGIGSSGCVWLLLVKVNPATSAVAALHPRPRGRHGHRQQQLVVDAAVSSRGPPRSVCYTAH